MTYFQKSPKTIVLSVNPNQADVYKFDLFGLLVALNVPLRLHWLTMRMNGYTSPTENDDTLTQLMIPDQGMFDNLAAVQQATLIKLAAAVQ